MYFPDLTPYSYAGRHPTPKLLAVGWLDEDHSFDTGEVSTDVLECVLSLCFKPVEQMLGFHGSPFLKPAPFGYPVEYKGKKRLLGSAEIRIPGVDGVMYAAPDLIYHYMKDCKYMPPKVVIDALVQMVRDKKGERDIHAQENIIKHWWKLW